MDSGLGKYKTLLLAGRYPVSGMMLIRFTPMEMPLTTTSAREEAMKTVVVVSVVGSGPAWPRLLIRVVRNSTSAKTSSNKLRLLDKTLRTLPLVRYTRETGKMTHHRPDFFPTRDDFRQSARTVPSEPVLETARIRAKPNRIPTNDKHVRATVQYF